MKKFRKPWYRPTRGVWYVTIRGKQYNLGPNRDEAFRRYHELMSSPPPTSSPRCHPQTVAGDSVAAVIVKFLGWVQQHRAPRCFEWYQWRLQQFARFVGPSLTVAELKHFHLDEFLDSHPKWSSGTKHGMAQAMMRCLRWAKKKGHIDNNPLADFEKPKQGRRNVVIPLETYQSMLRLANSEAFRQLIEFTWHTGARPQESLAIEGRHVDLANARIVFPAEESKGKQWPRIIYLNEIALAMIQRLITERPDGKLFRNTNGRPWTTFAVNCAFRRLQLRMGFEKLRGLGILPKRAKKTALKGMTKEAIKEHEKRLAKQRESIQRLARQNGPKYSLYAIRHSFATHALAKGIDALTVAILLGHRDPSMLARVYQHLSQNPDYLREAARKATG